MYLLNQFLRSFQIRAPVDTTFEQHAKGETIRWILCTCGVAPGGTRQSLSAYCVCFCSGELVIFFLLTIIVSLLVSILHISLFFLAFYYRFAPSSLSRRRILVIDCITTITLPAYPRHSGPSRKARFAPTRALFCHLRPGRTRWPSKFRSSSQPCDTPLPSANLSSLRACPAQTSTLSFLTLSTHQGRYGHSCLNQELLFGNVDRRCGRSSQSCVSVV